MISSSQTKPLAEQLIDWFDTETGRLLLMQEHAAFARLTNQIFGFQMLQIGLLSKEIPFLAETRVKQHTLVGTELLPGFQHYLAAEAESLPILSDSIDAVILPHTLDFCCDPQQVLREVERILVAEGRLVISGFNPASLWGLVGVFKRKTSRVPWSGHFVSYTRLHDWLSLLGFDVEETEVFMFRPPLENSAVMQKFEFLEKAGPRLWPRMGSVYMIRAVKRVSTLTPIQPIWKRRPRLLSHVVEPTTRGVNRGKTG